MMQPPRAGFTFIEIAVSLVLVAIAILTIFLVVPTGIHSQAKVRYRLIAATKALEMVNAMRQQHPSVVNDTRDMDKEGIFPWDARMTYKSMAPDMEAWMENLRGTLKPLPDRIAARLDSDDDEIGELLDAGGRLYYFFPAEPTGALDASSKFERDTDWIAMSRKLLVGVVGNPQQNSILYHPSVKAGPYQDFAVSPPTHGRQDNSRNWDDETRTKRHKQSNINYDALCRDPDVAQVMLADDTYVDPDSGATRRFGFWPFAEFVFQNDSAYREVDQVAARRYVEAYLVAALWYANRQGISNNTLMYLDHYTLAEGFADRYHDDWKKVLAMRYVAHAAAALTSYFPGGIPDDGHPVGGDAAGGDDTDMIMGGTTYWDAAADEGVRVRLMNITAWHEAALRMSILHGDLVGPYDWSVSRPLNRQVMMDHPLVQLDLWSDPISAQFPFQAPSGDNQYPRSYPTSMGTDFPPLVVNNVVTRSQWRCVFPQPITRPGLPKMFPGRHRDTNGDGVVDHRDSAYTSADGSDYPPRILDTDGDGDLDADDNPVPTPSVTSQLMPVMVPVGSPGQSDWDNYRQDLDANGQPAVGDPAHFNLTAPFQPSHRCRQLVFWAANWQAYSDFETAPSAEVDASRYPLVAPHAVKGASTDTAWSAGFVQRSDYQRQMNVHNAQALIVPSARNPELVATFRMPSLVDSSGNGDFDGEPYAGELATVGEINTFGGWDECDYFRGNTNGQVGDNGGGAQTPDIRDTEQAANAPSAGGTNHTSNKALAETYLGHDLDLWNMMIFLGRYGANRDGMIINQFYVTKDPTDYNYTGRGKPTGTVDGGHLSPSVRLRAITVARFNFYDPRLSGSLRY